MTSFFRRLSPDSLGTLRLIESISASRGAMTVDAEHAEDVELVRRALAGESRSVDLLVGRLQCIPRILGVFNARLGSALEAGELAEVVQDVMALFWSRIVDYSGRASLETWAYGFCLNHFMAVLRKRRRRIHERLDEEGHPDPRRAEVPADEYDSLHRSLELLDPGEERVIRLKYFDELTFEEIGTSLRLSPNTVKTRFYRGMKKLEQLLRRNRREHG